MDAATVEKLGIEHVKKLFLVVIDLGNAAGAAFEDKKINLRDVKALMSMAHSMKEMSTEVDFKAAMPEFKDLDANELDELAQLVDDNLDIPQDMVEDKVQQIFHLGVRLFDVVREMIDLVEHPEAMG